jgi:hypothetical protein
VGIIIHHTNILLITLGSEITYQEKGGRYDPGSEITSQERMGRYDPVHSFNFIGKMNK